MAWSIPTTVTEI
jgi:hypothetical protein